MKFIFTLTFVILSSLGHAQSGVKIVSTDSSINLMNTHGVYMTELTSDLMNIPVIEKEIKSSDHKDSKIITSVLAMHADPKSKMRELLNLRKTYKFVSEIIDDELNENLKSEFGRRQFRKMMKKR